MLQCILGKNWRSARYYAVRHFFSGWTSPRSMRNRWFSRHFENRDNTIVTVIDHVGWWTTAPIRTRTITKGDQIIKFIQSFTSSSASFHSSLFLQVLWLTRNSKRHPNIVNGSTEIEARTLGRWCWEHHLAIIFITLAILMEILPFTWRHKIG